ncbi:hypothetical protein [Winogradskyella undariae]|uniref:hypothetical protein n=1 Tax=Winogradskyella undariae TaxID=1285465 RepID=UPI0015CCF39A|nr:hypothetical protein [Winogradskyella undariae]
MKRVFSLLITFLFLLVISQRAVVMVHFKLNQKVIAKQFCVNQDKPELQCNGKCYLHKELQKKEHKDSEKIINTKNFDLVLNSNYEYHIDIKKITKKKELVIYQETQHKEPYLEILVPPPIYV